MKKLFMMFFLSLVIVVLQQGRVYASTLFYDDFVTFDSSKWNYLHNGGGSFAIENEEAKFTIKNYYDYLESEPIVLNDWDILDISGQWRIVSSITPEYLIHISDANDPSKWLRITYKSWDDILKQGGGVSLWIRDSANPSPYTADIFYRTPPSTMTDFSIQLTETGWTVTEGSEAWSYASTTLADATGLKIKIGGWDASTLSNQIVYFDNIKVESVPAPAPIFLLASGLVTLAAFRRKFKK